MTYNRLKNMVKGFTFGDTLLPSDKEILLALLEAAYGEIANHVTALKLLSASTDAHIIRKGPGGQWIRKPKLPNDDTDELDIDDELGQAVARLISSYISKEKMKYHFNEASRIMYDYQSKVDQYIKWKERQGAYDNVK